MDPTEHKQMEDGQTPTMRMIKGVTMGLVPGILWGTLFAVGRQYEPRVGSRVASSLLIIGNRGLTYAAVGGVWVGIELLLEKYRQERDILNQAAAGFVAGASILGRNIPGGKTAGVSFGFTCANMPFILYNIRRIRSNQKSLSGK